MTGATRRAVLDRAGALADVGRVRDAAAAYGELLREAPDDVHALCGLSRCLGKMGRPADGLELAGRAAELAPDSDWPHRLRSAHLLLLGRPRRALVAALAARDVDPVGFATLLSVFEAQVALRAGRDAAETAGAMVASHPAEAEAHNAVGRAAMMRRGWASAEDAFREALRLAPQEPVYQSNLAVALERRGRRREAMRYFRGAVRTDPGNPAVRRQLVHAIERRLATVCIAAAAVGIAAVAFVLDLGRPVTWAIAVGIGAGMLGALVVLRWWRLRQLDETLRTFYRHERRRWRAVGRDVLVLVLRGRHGIVRFR